jgi:hypothetical protein
MGIPCHRADAELIERACEAAARCHQGQLRLSGDPYITHPVAVATILARLDAPSVKATLKTAHGAVLLVVSSDSHDLLLSCSGGIAGHTASRLVTVRFAGHDHQGWIHVPAAEAALAGH